jgi:tetratricopeptide (TPR) repeat protein
MVSRVAGVTGVGLVAALVAATVWVQPFVSRPYLHTNLYLPSGRFVEQASLGYHELASDMVWFQAVQYYGGYALSQHDLAYFGGLIDIVNELDPHFAFPYIFGAVVMAQDMGDFDRGIHTIRRGMQNNPSMYELPFEAGFLYYTVAHDDSAAARYFDLASRLPGGKERAGRFAAFVYSKAGHTETSMRMWEEIARDDDEQPYMRDLAKHYLAKLKREAARQGSNNAKEQKTSPSHTTETGNDI